MLDNLNGVTFHARTTTGQGLSIRYDATANAMVMVEQDWFAASFRSSAVLPKSRFSKRLGSDTVVMLARRRKPLDIKAAAPR
jgi:hypothetical protein